jgi:hypothetical protein
MNPKIQSEIVQKPETKKAPEHLNKMQILKKFKASEQQNVDLGYDSGEDKVKTLDFDKEVANIKNVQGIDLAFCVDTTGSMSPFMKSIKELMRKIIKDGENFAKGFQNTKDLLKVGIVAYRDHGDEKESDSYLTKKQDFTDGNTSRKFLNELTAKGGLDKAEAVFDGLNEVINLSWRKDSSKFLVHFIDGPPHGSEYGPDERYPNGCPCDIKDDDIFYPMRELNLKYSLLKLNDDVDVMCKCFLEFFDVDVIKLEIDYDKNEKKTQVY